MRKVLVVCAFASLAVAIGMLASILPGVILQITHVHDGGAFGAEVSRRVAIAATCTIFGLVLYALSKVRKAREAKAMSQAYIWTPQVLQAMLLLLMHGVSLHVYIRPVYAVHRWP